MDYRDSNVIGFSDDYSGRIISGWDDTDYSGRIISGWDDIDYAGEADDAADMAAQGYSVGEIAQEIGRRRARRRASRRAPAAPAPAAISPAAVAIRAAEVTSRLTTGRAAARTVGQSIIDSDQRKMPLPLGTQTGKSAGDAWSLSINLQRPFQPDTIVLEATYATTVAPFTLGTDAAAAVLVNRIDVGTDNQLAANGSMPLSAFKQNSFLSRLKMKAAGAGYQITVSGIIQSWMTATVDITGVMYGVGAEN